jgi:2-methylisocitrate lyase-like PEP mutase family enzyme
VFKIRICLTPQDILRVDIVLKITGRMRYDRRIRNQGKPMQHYGPRLKAGIEQSGILPFIGVYDTFSAGIAGQHFNNIFISGFSFAASYYGLPDIGFIAWPDIVDFTRRVRSILPGHHIIVDMDDGYSDVEVACHAAWNLEQAGASAIVLEDQQRPRRCGHLSGKQILPIEDYVRKLERVLETRRDMLVVARTDVVEEDSLERVKAYAQAGADLVLADGITRLETLVRIREEVGLPVVFNQIYGGKSAPVDLDELQRCGVSVVLFSTPCLFAAQAAVDGAMSALKAANGLLSKEISGGVSLSDAVTNLEANLRARDTYE